MKIEDAIQQKKFRSEHQKMFINLIYTTNMLKLKHALNLKPYDITPEQFNVLRILRGQQMKPVTVNLIADRMLDKNSNASRLVEKLRTKGLLERAVCPDDRRAVNIVISKKGMDLLEKLDLQEEEWVKDAKHLSVKEAEQLNILLDKLKG